MAMSGPASYGRTKKYICYDQTKSMFTDSTLLNQRPFHEVTTISQVSNRQNCEASASTVKYQFPIKWESCKQGADYSIKHMAYLVSQNALSITDICDIKLFYIVLNIRSQTTL